jgi:hypothetical protein
MTSLTRRVATGVALVVLAVPRAMATVVVPADLDTLVRTATLVAYGRVVSVEPRLVEARRRIERVVILEVAEYYKGQRERLLDVRVPGGRFGSLRTVTVGSPEFRVGEEVVLFLGGDEQRGRYPIGLWEGVFRVRAYGSLSSSRTVTPVPVIRNPDQAYRVLRGDIGRHAMRLDDFAEAIRQIAAGQAARRPAGRRS